jgi:glycosyltransferase involved in cell wall biosynthesis
MPKVSVIIPTHNQAHYLTECIQSVLDQTFQDFELIVVDDGSTDNTREVVDRFQDARIRYIYQENRGVSAARNNGIGKAIGEYIALLDSDDTWLTRKLEFCIGLLDSRPDVALVCTDMYLFDSDTGTDIGRQWQDMPDNYFRELKDGNRKTLPKALSLTISFRPTAVVIRRQVFDEVGSFDESIVGAEDYEMFVRILQRFPIDIINAPLIRYRLHATSKSKNFDTRYAGSLAVVNKILSNPSLSRKEIKYVRRKLACVHYDYGVAQILVTGKITLGRNKLITAIKVDPWWIMPYLTLVFSFLGNRVIQTLKSSKRRLARRS